MQNTVHYLCIYVSGEHIHKILSFYSVPKLNYRPLIPCIKTCYESYKITQRDNIHKLCLCPKRTHNFNLEDLACFQSVTIYKLCLRIPEENICLRWLYHVSSKNITKI